MHFLKSLKICDYVLCAIPISIRDRAAHASDVSLFVAIFSIVPRCSLESFNVSCQLYSVFLIKISPIY